LSENISKNINKNGFNIILNTGWNQNKLFLSLRTGINEGEI